MKQTLARPPINSYEAALRFMDGLDMHSIRLGLERILAILETLGNPQDQLPMVHIAGTNGKGSVTAMLSAILKAAGYAAGTFTSPHLVHIRERIAINGNPILPDDFQYEVNALKTHLEEHSFKKEDWPSFFEFLNVMAYRYFLRKNVRIALFETGLGGRLDSTNVVKHPHLTVITSIGLDHTNRLGNTLAAIAAEKAGILKAGSPLVLGPHLPEAALSVIQAKADALAVPVVHANADALEILPDSNPSEGLHIRQQGTGADYRLSLLGPYQKDNLATVLACVQQLRQQGFMIKDAHVREGLRQTRWPVRFQYFERHAVVLDGSHNADGFQSLAESLSLYFPNRPLYWLLSLRRDRSPEPLFQLIQQFPQTAGVIFTCAEPADKYHAPSELAGQLRQLQRSGRQPTVSTANTPGEALNLLRSFLSGHSDQNPLGVATGSLYTAGALLELMESPADARY
jgi:dihydrofolate synthase/folylpolyglutamate synthase